MVGKNGTHFFFTKSWSKNNFKPKNQFQQPNPTGAQNLTLWPLLMLKYSTLCMFKYNVLCMFKYNILCMLKYNTLCMFKYNILCMFKYNICCMFKYNILCMIKYNILSMFKYNILCMFKYKILCMFKYNILSMFKYNILCMIKYNILCMFNVSFTWVWYQTQILFVKKRKNHENLLLWNIELQEQKSKAFTFMKHYVSKKEKSNIMLWLGWGVLSYPCKTVRGFVWGCFVWGGFVRGVLSWGGFVHPPYCVCLNMTHCDSLTRTYYEYLIFWMFFRMENSKHDQLMH